MSDRHGSCGRGLVPRPRTFRRALLVPFLFAAGALVAQSDLQVQVLDSATAEPVIGAGALVVGTTIGAAADLNGALTITGIPDGAQVLRVSSVGYAERHVPFTAPHNGRLTVKLRATTLQLHEAVITVTRTNSRIEDAPQKIEVLGLEELQEEGSLKPGNIASLIGDISSVQIQQTSAASGAGVVRMQGLDGRHTLLLRDGMPAFGGLSGGFDLMRIPPLDLQRVELVKGPASTFNGGGAIAGSINFVSKAPADSLQAVLLLNRSSLAETNANAYISGPVGGARFSVFGGATVQAARDVDGDGYNDVPQANTYSLHPQVFARPWRNADLRAGMLVQNDTRTGGDMQALNAPDDTTRYYLRTHGERVGADLTLTQVLAENQQLVVKGAWSRYTQRDRSNFEQQQRAQDNTYAEAYYTQHTDRRTWVVGGSAVASTLRGQTISGQQLSTVGAFGQLALHRKRWPEIDLGLRTDAPTGYAVQVLPSIAAMLAVNQRLSLKANVGTGYQLPDRSRNYGLVYEGVVAGELAPNTVAERSLGGTVEWTWKHLIGTNTLLILDQTFFGTRITDPLALRSTADGTAQLYNADGHTMTQGVDNYLRITHGHTELYLGYTYTRPRYEQNGTTRAIPYTPQHRAASTLARTFGEHWRAGLEGSWNGTQVRSDGSSTREQYFVAAMVGYTTGPWTLVLNGENITDTRQTRWEPTVSGSLARPVYAPLWAPIDGRVINLSMMLRL